MTTMLLNDCVYKTGSGESSKDFPTTYNTTDKALNALDISKEGKLA